ncbi:MAG: hypothetical protein RTU30_16480 [Candidatus Thorarchaeota archaeon]
MVEKLKVLEFMVLKPGGIPIFHYSPIGTCTLDELLSGFLSAITSFATEFGEKSIQSLSFEGSELLYEQTSEEAMFIFLVETGASQKLLRAILRELGKRFLIKFKVELDMEIPIKEVFLGFEKDVIEVFSHYEGILHITSSLSSFVVPCLRTTAFDKAVKEEQILDAFHRDFGNTGTRILEAIDCKTSIYKMSGDLSIEEAEISEVIEYLSISGVLGISKICPQLNESDSRFDAYLDLIGLPRKDYQLLQRVSPLCNGERSLSELGDRLGVTAESLFEVFTKLGDFVQWNHVEVTGLP